MRILIVEDEPRVLSFLQSALTEEGHAVHGVSDGDLALETLRSSEWDLVILDWLLPERDGVSVCKAMRCARNRTPVLMLTAKDAVEDRITGLDAGADDYLVKPFALGELLARCRALLRRRSQSGPILQAGAIRLNPAAHTVHSRDTEILLTAREFSLLEYLLRNKGNVVSRSMIAEHVWDFDGGTNVVDVYISYLRNKLDPDHTVIRTVRGVGYSIVADHD